MNFFGTIFGLLLIFILGSSPLLIKTWGELKTVFRQLRVAKEQAGHDWLASVGCVALDTLVCVIRYSSRSSLMELQQFSNNYPICGHTECENVCQNASRSSEIWLTRSD
ncbi:hypothetical protein FN846DRAFT_1006697 [Sphaerosporella brunnea]|uniref:Uncharacterized protein n=1 Tax=Sphaerosporella brunnea TaxID=1250544 RepID=A0A5J5FB44_9PEZI|nr:hypothetical protein FN846DRAFT_1006697 [Sphaerosporella brunnea]